MKRPIILAVLLASALSAAAHPADAPSFVVIVNTANAATLTRDELANIFMKRITRWDDHAVPILVVDALPDSPVREAFSRAVLHRGVGAMEAYWQQQIFSGRDVPPVQKETDAEVVAFVRRNPGALGYVSGDARLDGVRVLPWK
jgi:ABC-type phosphate transport system substrate-binding protein